MTLTSLILFAIIAEVGLAAIMSGAWAIQRRTGNSGWIDATWTFGVGAMSALLALVADGSDDAPIWRRATVALLVAVWSLRLGGHIVRRTLKAGDDPRYRMLIEEWGPAAPRRLFQFLQAQGLVGAILAVSVALAAHAPSVQLRIQDVVGVALFVIAVIGEGLADAQLAKFQADAANRGKICDIGLWRRSRHPNYFFEWLVWVAFAVIAADATGAGALGFLALLAPAIMYLTLRYASGVPPLEAHMLRSRGDAFRAYQARTPIFFPRLTAPRG
jgi:steroid 5-alpha reductase family enzyme